MITHQSDRMKTMDIHPEQRHQGHQMSDMQGRRCRVDANVGAHSALIHQIFETAI